MFTAMGPSPSGPATSTSRKKALAQRRKVTASGHRALPQGQWKLGLRWVCLTLAYCLGLL